MSKLLAWLVHFYTALGLVCAAAIALLIVQGDDASLRRAFLVMIVATLIDATDGWLARRARVKEVLPGFDGATLDNLVDFLNYTALPLLLIWRAGLLPGRLSSMLLLPLLASAYGFSQVHAKTDDGFFLGFPSYWNIVAFYLYVLKPLPALSLLLIGLCSALTFVPTLYLYASRGGPFARTLNLGAVAWTVMLVLVLQASRTSRTLALVSLAYPLLYLALSAFVTVRARRLADPRLH